MGVCRVRDRSPSDQWKKKKNREPLSRFRGLALVGVGILTRILF